MPQQERSESARERRIALYKSDQRQQQKTNKNKPEPPLPTPRSLDLLICSTDILPDHVPRRFKWDVVCMLVWKIREVCLKRDQMLCSDVDSVQASEPVNTLGTLCTEAEFDRAWFALRPPSNLAGCYSPSIKGRCAGYSIWRNYNCMQLMPTWRR